MHGRWTLLLILLCCHSQPVLQAADRFPVPEARAVRQDPAGSYEQRSIQGWTVRISQHLQSHQELKDAVVEEVNAQLYRVSTLLPAAAVDRLRSTDIWIEYAFPERTQYHPSAAWLKANGYIPEKCRAVEIACAAQFLQWQQTPVLSLLHELMHAWHDQVLGFNDPRLVAAHKRAVESGIYDRVQRISGRQVRHYALENPQEFFAEMSEAYLYANDYYPFVAGELKSCDPQTYALIKEIWTAAADPKKSAAGSPNQK